MTAAIVLPLLQVDLGELYLTDERKNYLSQVIDAALAFIAREGITLEDTVEDLQLVEMYAAYLVRKRNTTEAMPRMLRWALNNRLFSQKSGG
jgi:hypothetical protein